MEVEAGEPTSAAESQGDIIRARVMSSAVDV
jgi:hypothetical protein